MKKKREKEGKSLAPIEMVAIGTFLKATAASRSCTSDEEHEKELSFSGFNIEDDPQEEVIWREQQKELTGWRAWGTSILGATGKAELVTVFEVETELWLHERTQTWVFCVTATSRLATTTPRQHLLNNEAEARVKGLLKLVEKKSKKFARTNLGIEDPCFKADEFGTVTDADLEDRPVHNEIGLPEYVSEKDTAQAFRAPGLFKFLKGLAPGFGFDVITKDLTSMATPAEVRACWPNIPKDWLRIEEGPKYCRTTYYLKPFIKVQIDKGHWFMVNTTPWYRGVYYSTKGPVNVFAYEKDYRTYAVVGTVALSFHYSNGKTLLESSGTISRDEVNILWKHAGIPEGSRGWETFPKEAEVLRWFRLSGMTSGPAVETILPKKAKKEVTRPANYHLIKLLSNAEALQARAWGVEFETIARPITPRRRKWKRSDCWKSRDSHLNPEDIPAMVKVEGWDPIEPDEEEEELRSRLNLGELEDVRSREIWVGVN